MNSTIRLIIFVLCVLFAMVAGYMVYEVYEFTFNLIQLTALGLIAVPLIGLSNSDGTDANDNDNDFDISHRDPKADLKVVQDMAKQMLKTINEYIEESSTVMGFKDTGHTYEIEWIIDEENFLKSYQEVAIIPYEKVHELEYWQEITKIIIRNNKMRSKKQQEAQKKPETTKRSRTKTEQDIPG